MRVIGLGEYEMSKKTRKRIARKNPTSTASAIAAATDSRPATKSVIKVMPSAGKVYLSSEDLDKRYQYVKDDLKRVAIIAIPMILGLIVVSFFIKI